MPVASKMVVLKRLSLCVAACAALAVSASAHATTATVGAAKAGELRVAFARTPHLTTVWTSVRIDDDPGAFALIVPLPAGAFVDQSSDAWFEALEAATAPRVFPPEGLSPYCPGESGPDNPFHIAGSIAHTPSVAPETIALVDDAAAVSTWASAQGLEVTAELQGALGALAGVTFLCVRYTAPGGQVVTPALRVSAPAGMDALPFSITRASSSDLRVSAWFFGAGRASLDGATTVPVPGDAIAWDAREATSSYVPYRDELLAGQPGSVTLESAGHDALLETPAIANGTATIDALAATYFERASAYGNAASNPDPCIDASKLALAAAKPVGAACPRGDLAALAGDCASVPPGANEVDPAKLLCGPAADDLAIAMSGLVPATTWLTRRTFVIAQKAFGKDRTVSFSAGPAKLPVVQAGSVDLGGCFGGAGGSGGAGGTGGSTTSTSTSSSTGSTGSTGSGNTSSGAGYNGSGNNGSGNNGSGNSSAGDDTSTYVDLSGCSCDGTVDTGTYESSSSGDDCGGDTSDSYDTGDDCAGDSSAGSSDDCGGDTADASDGCSGDSGGASDSCSGDSGGGDCTVGGSAGAGRHKRGPKLSVIMMAAFAALLPLRRRGTRKRRGA